MVHSWVANTADEPDLTAFQSTSAGESNKPDPPKYRPDPFARYGGYPASAAKYLPEERYAYVAEAYGAGGLNAIPESLRPFYQDLLTEKPRISSPMTGKPNPGLTPQQSLSLVQSTRTRVTRSDRVEEAEQARIASINKPIPKDSWLPSLKTP